MSQAQHEVDLLVVGGASTAQASRGTRLDAA